MSVRTMIAMFAGIATLGASAAQAGDFGFSIRIGDRDRCDDRYYYSRPAYYTDCYDYRPVYVDRCYSRPIIVDDCSPRYYPRVYRSRSVYYSSPRYYHRSRSVRVYRD